MLKNEIQDLFYKLVKIQSDTGTKLERDAEKFIYDWIGNIPYFKENPELYGKYEMEDSLERAAIWGLLKGEGKETVILLHHHDVVDSFDYGIMQDVAYEPEKLIKELKNADLNEDIREDLESGKWIFGRGTADMKAAASIHLVLLKHYSENPNFKGNILLLSVPDEESLSLGARKGASLLRELKDKYDLRYKICIDGEPHEKDEEGKGVFYEGSVGKTMVVVYVRGRKTHLGHIFQGINPSHILSGIVSETDVNPIFSDVVEGEVSPPPSWSFCRDTKKQYDASIPESAGGYFSVLTLNQTPKDILDNVKKLSEKAFDKVIDRVNQNYKKFREKGNMPFEKLPWEKNVLLYSEAYEMALKDSGDKFVKAFDKEIEKIKKDISEGKTNIPDSNMDLISITLDYIKDKSPKVVIAFTPPFYPHIANLDFDNIQEDVKNLNKEIVKYAKEELDEEYVRKHYFMGISDLSYVALNDSEEVIPYISPNMPHWDKTYSIPFEDLKQVSAPIVNIGPWGKDYHKFTERVLEEDVFIKTPAITKHTIEYLLSK